MVTLFERDGTKLVEINHNLYSYGGWRQDPRRSYNDIYRSQDSLTEWIKLADAAWHPRHCFGVACLDSAAYVLGGDNLNQKFDVWSTVNGEDFSLVAKDLQNTIGNRMLYGCCVHKGKIFVLGGQKNLGLNSGLNDVWSSANGRTWEKTSSGLSFLEKNISGMVCSFNGRIWVIGGGYYDHPDSSIRWTNHIYSSPDGIEWRRQNDAPWKGRQFGDVCVWDNKIWLIGGNNGSNLNDIWFMKPDGNWVKFDTPLSFEGRHASGVAVYNNKLTITCGYYHNDCWVIEKQ